MSTFNKLWDSISLIGIDENTDKDKRRHIILMNQLAFTWIPFLLLYVIFFLYFDLFRPAIYLGLLIFMHIIALIINKFKLFTLTRFIESVVPSGIIVLIACTLYDPLKYDSYASVYVMVLACITFPFLYFTLKEKIYIIICIIISICYILFFSYFNKILYQGTSHDIVYQSWYSIMNFVVAAVIIIISFVYMRVINQRYLEQIESLLVETKNKGDEIAVQRDSLVAVNKELNDQKAKIEETNEELQQQNEEIAAQRDELDRQREIVVEQNIEITDSIQYAKQIQKAVFPDDRFLKNHFIDYFIYFKPKDIVSGDFFYASKIKDHLIVAAADCTGHGVPGAFMSMLGIAFLNEITRREDIKHANDILDHLRVYIIEALNQNGIEENSESSDKPVNTSIKSSTYYHTNVKDGMDIALCVINENDKTIQFSGANRPLLICTGKGEEAVELIKGDQMPIAIHPQMKSFKNHDIIHSSDNKYYIFSDGIVDQFGGPKGKKFKRKKLQELICSSYNETMVMQRQILDESLRDWMKKTDSQNENYEQIDDITIIGFTI